METPSSAFLQAIKNVVSLFYPHLCAGCGADLKGSTAPLCFACLHRLPVTNFSGHAGNPVEKIFWGRLPLVSATSLCYFTRNTIVQHILHELKYKGNLPVGKMIGRMMGESLLQAGRFDEVDMIIPLPLHPRKEKIRGYNQAKVIGDGIAEVTGWPVMNNVLIRKRFTDTQTQKTRAERWENIREKFACVDARSLENKHVLLVDDVITTGATLEACGMEILINQKANLSIATMAYAIK